MSTVTGGTVPYQRVRRALAFEAHRDDTGLPEVDGQYSRTAWLPVLGPAPWVVWGTIARKLPPRGFRVWNVIELERVNGIDDAAIGLALYQLARCGLAVSPGDDVWRIRRPYPPLPEALLTIAEPAVRVAHRRAFPVGAERRDRRGLGVLRRHSRASPGASCGSNSRTGTG
jgi:hypothetical protein